MPVGIGGRSAYQRSAVADILAPDNGYRGRLERNGIAPKDHMKENRAAIKYAEIRNRERQEMANRAKSHLYKLEQFRDVQSKVYDAPKPKDDPEDTVQGVNTSRSSVSAQDTARGVGDFLQKGTGAKRREALQEKNMVAREVIQSQIEDARFIADRPNTPRKGQTPKSDELGVFKPRTNANWIARNKIAALNMAPPSEKASTDISKTKTFGKIPEYLKDRKAQWAAEEEELRRKRPDPNCPKGMKLMPEEERVATLEILLQSKEEAMKQLASMPFIVETPSAKKKQSELEEKLKEIENAIILFSKTKVYIAAEMP